MSNLDIRQAFESRIAAFAATMSPPALLSWENFNFVPNSTRVYFRCAMAPARTSNPAFGVDFDRLQGFYQISVYGIQDRGPGPAEEIADAIIALFPRGSITQNGVVVNIDTKGSRTQGLNDDNGFYFIPVRVRYRQDVIS